MNTDWIRLLKQKPKKAEIILFVAGMVILSVTFISFSLFSDLAELEGVKAQIETKKAAIALKQKTPLPIPVPEIKKPDLDKKNWVGTIEAVRDASETALNLSYLQGGKIMKSQFSPITIVEERQKRDVSLSVTGNYYVLEQYLDYLENMPAPLVISSFSIQPSGTDPDVLNLEVSGAIYGAN